MNSSSSVFGFPEFLTALALLMLVYSASDARYSFRIHAAALPLPRITFFAIVLIGAGSLIIDVWYAEGWPTIDGGVGSAGLQAVLAGAFLGLTVLWVLTAFVRPPIFSQWNAKYFYNAVFWRVMQGDAKELSVAAGELADSMRSIVRHCPPLLRRGEAAPKPNAVQQTAHQLLMLIGNRRFCKQVARTSPETAINLFYAMADAQKSRLPVRAFVRNLMSEALGDPESILYDEADEFSSDLVGVAKPFSRAVFGNYNLVEQLQDIMASPTDLGLIELDLNASQYQAYASASLIFVEAFLNEPSRPEHSYALNSVFDTMKRASRGAYSLSDVEGSLYGHEQTRRVRVAVRFIERVMDLLKAAERRPVGPARSQHYEIPKDIYDLVAQLMFEIVDDVSSVEGLPEHTWTLHHNMVWSDFFGFDEGLEWNAVRRRLVRRLHAHLAEMNTFANYHSARLLGYSLNILGVEDRVRASSRDLAAFHRILLRWFATNYLTLKRDYPDVAEACLIGGISYDETNNRLVKTYAKGTKTEPTRRFLQLCPARAEPWDRWA